ncbi:MAG: peptidase domain-containing ABC transporter [Planctomycetaceae bacterium]
MSIPTNSSRDAAIILDRLARGVRSIERSAVQRSLIEATRAWAGPEDEQWWRWVSEAASSLGMSGRAVDLTLVELQKLASNGARIVVRDPDSGEWFAVLKSSKKKLLVLQPRESEKPRWIHRRTLLKTIKADQLRCVAFSPQPIALNSEKKATPLERLLMLLRPEWSDIWIVVLFAFVVGLLMLATPMAVEALVNNVAFGRFLQPVFVLSVILFVFLAFSGALKALQTYVVEIVQRRLFARVAGDLAYRLPRLRGNATDGEYAPELVNRFFDVVLVQKICAQFLLDGIGLILSTLVGMAVLGFYHPWLLGFDAVLLAGMAFVIFVLGRGAVKSSIKESKTKYRMAAWLEDLARCPTTFRSSGGTDFAMERADSLVHDYLHYRKLHFRILMRQILFALTLQALASTVLLGIGGWLVVDGQLSLGQLVAAELIVTVIVAAFAKLGKHVEGFYDVLASVDKLGVLFDLPLEDQSGIMAADLSDHCAIQLSDVKAGSKLSGFSLNIAPRETVAVCGPSGSGKTTIAELIYGTRGAASGSIKVDGIDPRDFRPDILRQQVALVGEPEVFQGSIDENVHLHRPAVMPTDVHNSLALVGLQPLLNKLPHGADTTLTSGGGPLSPNQLRLLSIARAMAGEPGLVVVDGTLDALPDADLEIALQALTDERRTWTTLVLTGRSAIAERLERAIYLQKKDNQRLTGATS